MSSFSLLVTLHNLVNIPVPLAESGDGRTFTVEVQLRDAVTTSFSAPPVSASFSPSDIIESSPHLFEVQLDKVSQPGSLNSAKVWRCAASSLEVVVVVREAGDRAGGRERTIATSSPLIINPREVVEWEKLATRIVGTEVGQVGLSFRVDPADKPGYRARLETFLRQYNPQGLRLIESVVEAVPETDTFAKLYKKYKLIDYPERLKAFFSVYGPAFVSQIPALLEQWENKEMELMNHLILDNGPELKDVNPSERLAAFLSAYDLEADSPRVKELSRRARANTPEELLNALVKAYGPEPDPRTYTFPPTRYSSASESSPMMAVTARRAPGTASDTTVTTPTRPTAPAHLATSPTAADSALRSPPPSEARYLSLAMTSPPPSRPAAARPSYRGGGGGARNPNPSNNHDHDDAEDTRRPEKRSATAPGAGPQGDFYGDQHFGDTPQAAPSARHGRTTETENGADMWRKLCNQLGTSPAGRVQEADLFYGTAEDFERRLDSLGVSFTPKQKDALVVEWERRARQALQLEPLLQDDPYFGSAAKEAVRLTGLESLHLQAMTVTAVFHREHHAAFAARLDAAKERKAERLVLVGDATTLERVARCGLKLPLPLDGAASRPPSAIFLQRPFQHWTSRHTTGLLICDVVVGRTQVNPVTDTIPAEATAEFLARYDSCVFVDKANGPAVAVYEPQQVLPRLLLHCTVDPTVIACPAHLDRPVEYYVADCDAFACSRCVVLGEFKGKEATPIAEAAVLARARLAEIHRTSLALRDSMDAFEKQLAQETAMMANAPRRVRAEREVERLRREVEERIRGILAEVELADKEQLARIQLDRKELEATRDGARRLCEAIDKATVDAINPLQVVSALQKVQQDRELEQLLDRAEHRIPDAPLEKVAPLAGLPLPPPPPGPPSHGSLPVAAAVSSAGPARFNGAYGLNESRISAATGTGTRTGKSTAQPPPTSASKTKPTPPPQGDTSRPPGSRSQPPSVPQRPSATVTTADPSNTDGHSDSDEDEALYDKYVRALARNAQEMAPPPSLMKSQTVPSSSSAVPADPPAAPPRDLVKEARRSLTKGWSLLRQGDIDGARAAWESVSDAFDPHTTALGAKARAYVAEAIDKNYEEAGEWYERALQLEPEDRMTAYNYGVLLEALLDQPRRALNLYECAAELGDKVAATRADQLRTALSNASQD